MHQASAIFGADVVRQIDRAEAVIARIHMGERVFEIDASQILALRGAHDRAGQAKARHAFFHQALGQQQQTALGVHHRVGQFRVQVERLVGGDGPGGGGPDDGESVFGQ